MLNCFLTHSLEKTISIIPICKADFAKWQAKQSVAIKNWLKASKFTAKVGEYCLLPDKNGVLEKVLIAVDDVDDFWQFGALPEKLPAGHYKIAALDWNAEKQQRAAIAWALGSYRFSKYKKGEPYGAKLIFPVDCDRKYIENVVTAIYWTRDLINLPAEDLGPAEFAETAQILVKKFGAKARQVIGEKLIKENFPAIHMVGRASAQEPRLLDLKWGKKKNAPKITLVGKGVCFDTGGLNIKPEAHMLKMKKDMAGAAHALGLARMIMQANLPVNLRVIIPVVENSVSAKSYRPGDIITMRSGKTVEVINTDAEGRLILGDALTLAGEDKPDLLLEFSSLTGAARVALGMDITAMFTENDLLANNLMTFTKEEQEPLWRLPLYQDYREFLDSKIADIANLGSSPYGSAITAALFVKEFMPENVTWAHFDLAAWNEKVKPGHPAGGEAYCLRGIFNYLQKLFS